MDADRKAAIRRAYSRFLRDDRILLSGHSHQAWPDCARDAQLEPFDDAAELVDDKWGRVFELQAEVGRRINARMGLAPQDTIAFGESSHQLVFRLLSAFPLRERPRIVASTGEFHSLCRQLARLREEGMEVVWVDKDPRDTLAARMIAAARPGTTMVALSAVLFEDAWVVDGLADVVQHAADIGAVPLVDAYHSYNCVPVDYGSGVASAFVTSGGYKYAGFGNGLCWLRIPRDCTLRPAYTGWFADFESLAGPRDLEAPVRYGPGAQRFAGATFDASALYRARAVLDHWDRLELDLPALATEYRRQTSRIIDRLDDAGFGDRVVSPRTPERRGGFVTVRFGASAGAMVDALRRRGVYVDARGPLLRLGPAPYVTDEEIDRGLRMVAEVARELPG
ncbi:MAG: aminotransferase class V-fold PLP-dependent enzyme [Myxococcota bacterium]